MRFVGAALALVFCVAAADTRAWAAADDMPPPVGLSLAVGAAVAMAPLAAGGATFAARDELDTRRAGIYTALTGLTFAPLAAHFVGREPRRALYFTIAPLVGSVITVATLESHPELLDHGHPGMRFAFGLGVSLAILGAVVGVADSAAAADRWHRHHPLSLASMRDGSPRF